MKFFHLSDLHLGKRVNAFSMIEDQKYILDQILKIADEEHPDGVIIAGDVYDKSIPPVEAVNLFDDFLAALSGRGLKVFLISGNHDSAERVSFGGRLMEKSGIYISPRISGSADTAGAAGTDDAAGTDRPADTAGAAGTDDAAGTDRPADTAGAAETAGAAATAGSYPGLLPVVLEDTWGPLNIYLIPYIHPSVIRVVYPDEKINDWTQAMEVLIRNAHVDPGARNIAVAHQYMTAGGVKPEECESEQKHIGGLDNVDVSVFDDFDYVALGHLHGPQRIGRDTIRYAGSPLKYSFSEEKHKKCVTIVEIREKGQVEIVRRELVPLRELRTIRGTFGEIMSPEYRAGLSEEDYYRIILTDEYDIDQALSRLRTRFYKNLMVLEYDNTRTRTQSDIEAEEEALEKDPIEVLQELYSKQNGTEMTDFQKELALRLIGEIWNEQ